MQVVNNDVFMRKGETFTLANEIFQPDGVTPYVVTDAVQNPCFKVVIRVAEMEVGEKRRDSVFNVWLMGQNLHPLRQVEPLVEDVAWEMRLPSSDMAGNKYLYASFYGLDGVRRDTMTFCYWAGSDGSDGEPDTRPTTVPIGAGENLWTEYRHEVNIVVGREESMMFTAKHYKWGVYLMGGVYLMTNLRALGDVWGVDMSGIAEESVGEEACRAADELLRGALVDAEWTTVQDAQREALEKYYVVRTGLDKGLTPEDETTWRTTIKTMEKRFTYAQVFDIITTEDEVLTPHLWEVSASLNKSVGGE